MFKAIRGARGGSNEVPKIRMKGIIVERYEDVGTEAVSRQQDNSLISTRNLERTSFQY